MNKKIEKLIQSKGENHIFPFLWVHGEEESVLREYMEAIQTAGIGAVCVESRPHPDYCGSQWWHDMDIIIDEAKKRDMKVWILDDSHFPTGYANGALKDAEPELCRQFVYYSSVVVTGPMKSAQLDISKHAKYVDNPMKGNYSSVVDRQKRRKFDDDKLISVCAVDLNNTSDKFSPVDITSLVVDGQLVWDIPPGKWKIYINYLTRNAGNRDNYINLINKNSVRKLIDAVYVPHFERYKDEFGKTIAGFFSDEPELGNGLMYNENITVGTENELPWSYELEEIFSESIGGDWKVKLPLLWNNRINSDDTANIRYMYMDIVTRLVEEDFSKQLGKWCEEHGVEYIGHLIEDNNVHARLGPSLGHYFRGLSGQHMAGIDVIRGQVVPGGEEYPTDDIFSSRDGEFYHYLLGKLGSSFAAIDPKKKGRTMCEIFGAYRWGEGVRMTKYLVDHFVVRGVNRYVPHAFSCKPYPDPDCPPHFYCNGHDPQFRHFGQLMRYLNRMSSLISDGKRVTPAAILYHGEAEWTGKYMLCQKPAHMLMDNQIDFDILPSDVFTEIERYCTDLSNGLAVNGQEYKVLIVPYAQYLPQSVIEAIIKISKLGFLVLFIDDLPTGVTDGDNELIKNLVNVKAVAIDDLANELKNESIPEISIEPKFDMLRYLSYEEEDSVYIFTNEDMNNVFKGTVTIPRTGSLYEYDVWNNKLYEISSEQNENNTVLNLVVEPYQSVVIVFGEAENLHKRVMLTSVREEKILRNWEVSLARSIEYPNFHSKKTVDILENIGLQFPEFSGFIKYKKNIEVEEFKEVFLLIEDAYEGVEVFVNDKSAGIQIAPPFRFDIGKLLSKGENVLTIEVATTLERERNAVVPKPNELYSILKKAPLLAPSGIVGQVTLLIQK